MVSVIEGPVTDNLDSRYEVYRFGAILMLHQFALKAPSMIYPRVNDILAKIWVPLRDSRVSAVFTCVTTSLIDRRQWSENGLLC